MKRCILVTTMLLLSASLSTAQDRLFTLQIPLNFQAIHPSISHVAVTCELRGYNPLETQRSTGVAQPLTVRTFVTKGAPPNLILFPLTQFGAPGQPPPPAAGPGGYIKPTVPAVITFTSNDFALNPAGLNDPANVSEAWCYFALRATDGTLYHPVINHPAVRAEIDNGRTVAGQEFVGPVALTQPPASQWPPVLSPQPQVDPMSTYVWHQAWIFRMPKWAEPTFFGY